MRTVVRVLLLALGVTLGVTLGVVSPPLAAQALAPGKYSGTIQYQWMDKPMQDMATLTIEKVDGDRFEGSAWLGAGRCRVDTPVRGTLEGDTLKVRGKPVKPDCGIAWDLQRDGARFVGKTAGGATITLSR